jgi:hypothetical protein
VPEERRKFHTVELGSALHKYYQTDQIKKNERSVQVCQTVCRPAKQCAGLSYRTEINHKIFNMNACTNDIPWGKRSKKVGKYEN